jgi:hypothetical protein
MCVHLPAAAVTEMNLKGITLIQPGLPHSVPTAAWVETDMALTYVPCPSNGSVVFCYVSQAFEGMN